MKYHSHSVEDTYKFAKTVADTLSSGDILLLNGELGAGKTTFTKGLAKALGVKDTVTSPTFTIMSSYEGGRVTLYHFDMYRITSGDELYELGFDDYIFGDGVSVIEWNKLKDIEKDARIINVTRLSDTDREFELL